MRPTRALPLALSLAALAALVAGCAEMELEPTLEPAADTGLAACGDPLADGGAQGDSIVHPARGRIDLTISTTSSLQPNAADPSAVAVSRAGAILETVALKVADSVRVTVGTAESADENLHEFLVRVRAALGPTSLGNAKRSMRREGSSLPLEELGDHVQHEALAEAARAGQEAAVSPADQTLDVRRLVHIAASVLAQPAEGLDADREPPVPRIAVTWAAYPASEGGDALPVRQRTHDRRRARCLFAIRPLHTPPRSWTVGTPGRTGTRRRTAG